MATYYKHTCDECGRAFGRRMSEALERQFAAACAEGWDRRDIPVVCTQCIADDDAMLSDTAREYMEDRAAHLAA